MPYTMTTDTVVLAPDETCEPLSAEADRLGWPLIATPHHGEVLRRVRRLQPKAALVQAIHDPLGLRRSIELIDVLHRRCARLTLLAWSPEHDARVERAVRCAGVNAYACGRDGLSILEQIITALPTRDGPERAHGPPSRARAPDRLVEHPP